MEDFARWKLTHDPAQKKRERRKRPRSLSLSKTGVHMCGHLTLIAEDQSRVKLQRVRCHTWTCPRCAPRRKKRLFKEAITGRPNRLITLTVRPDQFRTPHEAARALSLAWRRCRDTLKRYHGHSEIESLAVFERHKSGWPHLHILVRSRFISQRWLSQYMGNRINSPIVDVRQIKTRKMAAAYVTKYLTKNPEKFRGTKRYWRTAAYSPSRKKKQKSPLHWRLSPAKIECWLHRAGVLESPHAVWPHERAEAPLPDW